MEKYNVNEVCSFFKTNEKYSMFSNMINKINMTVCNIDFRNSEGLYNILKFEDIKIMNEVMYGNVEGIIVNGNNGFSNSRFSKMKSKKYRKLGMIRKDWDVIQYDVMEWVLKVKVVNNIEVFKSLFEEVGDRMIVEESFKDINWGCLRKGDVFEGNNNLGKSWMKVKVWFEEGLKNKELKIDKISYDGMKVFDKEIEDIIVKL